MKISDSAHIEIIGSIKSFFLKRRTTLKADLAEIVLYDRSMLDTLEWPDTIEGAQARNFLLPLIREGSEKFISNVKTVLYILKIDHSIIPISVNEKEYQNSYVASNYCLIPLLEEWLNKKPKIPNLIKKPVTVILAAILKKTKINKVVFINNWLLGTNLFPLLTSSQVEAILAILQKKFPNHVLIWRNLETFSGQELVDRLKKLRFRALKTRKVYFYDSSLKDKLSPKVQYHHRRDFRLIEKEGYEIVKREDLKSEDIPRLLELYRMVYIDKYTSYSPQFTTAFLENVINNQAIEFVGIRKNGVIDGIAGYYIRAQKMASIFFGYDTSPKATTGLYRMMTLLLIKAAEEHKVALNDGSGAEMTKKIRGLKPFNEFTAIYDGHLSFSRRLFWSTAEVFFKIASFF